LRNKLTVTEYLRRSEQLRSIRLSHVTAQKASHVTNDPAQTGSVFLRRARRAVSCSWMLSMETDHPGCQQRPICRFHCSVTPAFCEWEVKGGAYPLRRTCKVSK